MGFTHGERFNYIGVFMNVSIFSLYWDNGKSLYELNKKVTDHFELNVNYHNLNNIRHGHWMDNIMHNCNSEVIGFFDVDCIPTNRDIVEKSISYVVENNSFIGIAQASNHIPPCSHIFAAPAFFFITKDCYMNRLNKPSFLENERSDVAEEVSYVAEEKNVKYRCFYPTHFERPSTEGVWDLSNYGKFAIGTHFNGGIYHLYQGRFANNVALFNERCNQIISGNFSTQNMISSIEL
jgi:hypothetical protein